MDHRAQKRSLRIVLSGVASRVLAILRTRSDRRKVFFADGMLHLGAAAVSRGAAEQKRDRDIAGGGAAADLVETRSDYAARCRPIASVFRRRHGDGMGHALDG